MTVQVLQVGMLADDVLRLPGHGRSQCLRPAERVGRDRGGTVVRWFYPGVILTLRRWAVGGVVGYRVAAINVVGEAAKGEGNNKRRRRRRRRG